jgi:hypothetical protein
LRHIEAKEHIMSNQTNISPAVRSLQNEQGDQHRRGQEGDLDKALEDTFPASDPVSMASPATSDGAARGQTDGRRSFSGRRSERLSATAGSIDGYISDIEERIREKPLAAAAIVAGLAWLYGRTR